MLRCDVSAWNKIFKRSIIDRYNIRFPAGLNNEDFFFYHAYMLHARSMVQTPLKLHHYRRRKGSIMADVFTGANTATHADHLQIAFLLYEEFEKHRALPALKRRFGNILLSSLHFTLSHTHDPAQKEKIYTLYREFDTNILRYRLNKDVRKKLKRLNPQQPDSFGKKWERWFKTKLTQASIKHRFWRRFVAREPQLPFSPNPENFTPFQLDNTQLLSVLQDLGRFTYIVNPGNMGDALISAATLDFFDRHRLPYTVYTEGAPQPETVVYSGGGIWIPAYERNGFDRFLPLLAQAERVVILPSSYRDVPALVNMADSRFTLFCRERESFDYLSAAVSQAGSQARVLLDHDMALRMSRNILQAQEVPAWRISKLLKHLYPFFRTDRHCAKLLRRDCEAAQSASQSDFDLSKTVYADEYTSSHHLRAIAMTMFCAVDTLDAVITDRLHVAIASMLMGKEVYMLDNSYKKLSSVYNHSLSAMPRVHLIDQIPAQISAPPSATDNFARLAHLVLGKKAPIPASPPAVT